MTDRLTRLREEMETNRVDSLFVSCAVNDVFHTHSANRRYISGFTGSTGYVLITPTEARMAVDFRYTEQAKRECPGFEIVDIKGEFKDWLRQLLRGLGRRRLAIAPADVSFGFAETIRRTVRDFPDEDRPHVVLAPPLIEKLRARKDETELAALEQAIAIADQAFETVAAHIEPGMTEKQVAWEIEKAARDLGAEMMSFNTIVGAGPWGALPHCDPRDVSISEGEPVVIDMGVIYDGYCSDMTRTIVIGEPDARFKEIYDIVLAAQLAAEELVESGMTGKQTHELAHAVIREAGYGEQFGHGLGHGVGLQIHELPRIAATADDVIEDGMVLTIEPGIYLPDWGGVRIEDIVHMKDGKARVLTRAPKLASL